MEKHNIPPYYNADSEILILGSFPSIKSREVGFYYSHPQNRFWQVLSIVFKEPVPQSIEEKKALLKKHKIALFDVCKSCSIKGSSDASIKNIKPNDITKIIKESKVTRIFLDGKTAYNLYNKYLKTKTKIEGICLPSTSPANATFTLSRLTSAYQVLTKS